MHLLTYLLNPLITHSSNLLSACVKSALLLSLVFAYPVYAIKCQPNSFDSKEQVSEVLDGQTLLLRSGTKLRLTGIKADKNDVNSTTKLTQLIGDSKTIFLFHDKDFVDINNQMLAHVFNQQGQNLQAELLKHGLAEQYLEGNNQFFWHCYQDKEIFARKKRLGRWQANPWQADTVDMLKQNQTQGENFTGRLSHHWHDKKDVHWLVLDNYLYVGISPADKNKFKQLIKQELLDNERIIAKGKVYFADKRWRMKLTHPWQLIRQYQLEE